MLWRFSAWLNDTPAPWRYAVLAALIAAPSLGCGLSIDDFAHLATLRGIPVFNDAFEPSLDIFNFADGDPERMRRVMDIGLWPWWTLPELRTAFWRPVTALTHALDYRLWPAYPALMHLQSLCWFGGAVFLAALCYRRFLRLPAAAALAALLFAIGDIHMLPAGWLANRNAEVALFWGLLTLLLHERGRRGSLWAAALAPVALALGLLSNEGALSTCGYLFAYACFLDGAAWRKRIGALAPYAAVVAVWRCAYLWLGYGAWGSPAYLDPAAEPLRYALAALERVPVLLTSLCFTPPADLYLAYPLPIKPFILLWCAAVLTVTAVLLSPLLKRPDSRFLALGMLLALLPACSTEPADRLMPFAAFGGLALIAQFLHAVYHRLIWVRTRAQRAFARTALTVFIITHALVSPLAILCGIPIFHWLMDGVERSAYATELDSSVSAKTIVFTNAPTMFHTAYFPVLRLIEGLPAPAHLRSLAPNSFGGTPMRVRRLDVYTLRVTPEHGYPIILLRNDAHAFAAGDRVSLTGVCVEVLRVNERGVPAEVTFTFDVPLEDASLLWLALRGGAYHPVSPPAIGEEVLWRTAPFVLGRWPKILDNLRRFLGGS